MATVIGRGRGRGLSKGWLGSFKPKPCPLKPEEIRNGQAVDGQFSNDDPKLLQHITDINLNIHTVDELSEKIAADILDERPALDQGSLETPKTNISSVLPQTSACLDEKPADKYDKVLVNAVHASEFIPYESPNALPASSADQHEFFETSEKVAVLGVLNDVIITLLDDPGSFDHVIAELCEHLVNFVTKEETVHEIVNLLVVKGKEEPNFSYIVAKLCHEFDQRKTLEPENSATFRKLFFTRCQEEFKQIELLMKDLTDSAVLKRISNIALLFGELCINMKIKDKIIPIFKKCVFNIVDMFLASQNVQLLTTLTRLLKLVGPELDIDRPRDVEDVFNKLRDFYLDKNKTENLPESTKRVIWHVYKLHTRDWDRKTSAPSSPVIVEDEPTKFELPTAAQQALHQKLYKSVSYEGGQVDWADYYAGDDTELYSNYFSADELDEEDEAYEEFLRISGQL